MKQFSLILSILCASLQSWDVSSFTLPSTPTFSRFTSLHIHDNDENMNELPSGNMDTNTNTNTNRRSMLTKTAQSILGLSTGSLMLDSLAGVPTNLLSPPPVANAAVGTLPEYADTNAVVQGITLNIADASQYQKMITFLQDSFDFIVLREREFDSVTEAWLGYGFEQASIPDDFEMPVSSFARYGGHASIHLRYDARSTELYYNGKGDAPGNNIAYLQVGVPQYRISQMVKNGGNVLDAYGFVNVVSPVGLPMRGIVGISPDPIMFVAINCEDVAKSRAFYEQLGLSEQKYPYARPSNGMGQFEPLQPKGSVYMAHTPNNMNMGILLLPSIDPERRRPRKIPVTTNPVVRSVNVVYNPSSDASSSTSSEDDSFIGMEAIAAADPSNVPIAFSPFESFQKEVLSMTKKNLFEQEP